MWNEENMIMMFAMGEMEMGNPNYHNLFSWILIDDKRREEFIKWRKFKMLMKAALKSKTIH